MEGGSFHPMWYGVDPTYPPPTQSVAVANKGLDWDSLVTTCDNPRGDWKKLGEANIWVPYGIHGIIPWQLPNTRLDWMSKTSKNRLIVTLVTQIWPTTSNRLTFSISTWIRKCLIHPNLFTGLCQSTDHVLDVRFLKVVGNLKWQHPKFSSFCNVCFFKHF